MAKNINGRIKNRNDTFANWTSKNPVLLAGELAIESDTNRAKAGNGTAHYNTLPYPQLGDGDFFEIDTDGGLMPAENPTVSLTFELDNNNDIMLKG